MGLAAVAVRWDKLNWDLLFSNTGDVKPCIPIV